MPRFALACCIRWRVRRTINASPLAKKHAPVFMCVRATLDVGIVHRNSLLERAVPVDERRMHASAHRFMGAIRAEIDELVRISLQVEQLRAETMPVHVLVARI